MWIQGNDYEGLGWNVFGEAHQLDRLVEASISNAIERFVHTNAPATGDQLTFFVAVEIMWRFQRRHVQAGLDDVP